MSVAPRALFRVRAMRAADVAGVLAIEQVSYDYPWSRRIFRDCLRVGYYGYVATDMDDTIAGYALLSVAVGEAHVLNLCVAPRMRGQGVARLLLDGLIAKARAERAEAILLEVRPSNSNARRLYKHSGFKRVATRPGYYPARTGREDALLLSRQLV